MQQVLTQKSDVLPSFTSSTQSEHLMRNEILTGIFGGLFIITLFVLAGSFIGSASSHGPKKAPAETTKTAPKSTEGAGKADPAAKTDAPKGAKKETSKTPTPAVAP